MHAYAKSSSNERIVLTRCQTYTAFVAKTLHILG